MPLERDGLPAEDIMQNGPWGGGAGGWRGRRVEGTAQAGGKKGNGGGRCGKRLSENKNTYSHLFILSRGEWKALFYCGRPLCRHVTQVCPLTPGALLYLTVNLMAASGHGVSKKQFSFSEQCLLE